jgi:hypothetical protein
MTNNPPIGCHPSNRWVLSCKQQIIALTKLFNVNNTNVLEHKIIVFSLVATAHYNLRSYCHSPRLLEA